MINSVSGCCGKLFPKICEGPNKYLFNTFNNTFKYVYNMG